MACAQVDDGCCCVGLAKLRLRVLVPCVTPPIPVVSVRPGRWRSHRRPAPPRPIRIFQIFQPRGKHGPELQGMRGPDSCLVPDNID